MERKEKAEHRPADNQIKFRSVLIIGSSKQIIYGHPEVGKVMKDNSLRDTGTLLCGGKDKTVVTTGDSCAFPQIIEIRLRSNEF